MDNFTLTATISKLEDAGFTVGVRTDGRFTVRSNKTNAVIMSAATEAHLHSLVSGTHYVANLPENRGNEYKKREFRAKTSDTIAGWRADIA